MPQGWADVYQEGQYHACEVCGGVGEVNVGDFNFQCICQMKKWGADVSHSLKDIRSNVLQADVRDLVTDGSVTNGDQLADAITQAVDWVKRPKGYFVLSGGLGVGKTHILRWMQWVLNPISLYLTASDFNVGVHAHRRDDTLSEYVDRIARAPVLLFDDWGMEYGGPLVDAQFTHIVDFRDRDTDSFPMAIATNKDGSQIAASGRVGSRVMNREKCIFVSLDLEDYRVKI